MSLFKAREFWTFHCDFEETYDQNCLHISRLNTESDYLITGCHNGILRIFKPSSELTEDNKVTGYLPSDLVLEKSLQDPILQLKTGKLISGSLEVQLALLQPRKCSVFALKRKTGETEHGDQYFLQLIYEHKLRRSAANFVVGPFGGSQNRDFICVQSLDGLLTFFEQETFAFCCFLPEFLLPSPLVYVPLADIFVTGSADWQILSFGYKHLSEIGEHTKEDDEAGKKITSNWSLNVGEAIVDLQVVTSLTKKESILVLGEKYFYCLSSSGRIIFMKRLEYSPLCFHSYSLGEDSDNLMAIIVSENNTLLLYQNVTLRWAAQFEFTPIAISRAFLKQIKGAVVAFSAEGRLTCSYLGTEPSVFIAPPIHNQQLDYEEVNKELEKLNSLIKSSYSETTLNSVEDVKMKIDISEGTQENAVGLVRVELIPFGVLDEVHLVISVDEPLKANPSTEFYSKLTENAFFESFIYLENNLPIQNLEVKIIVTYITSDGFPRALQRIKRLSYKSVMSCAQAIKDNLFKVVFVVNQTAVPISELFSDFSEDSAVSAHSAAFKEKHRDSPSVTVLLAKSTNRYRIQCDSILPLAIVVEETIQRLNEKFKDKKDFKITFSSTLPIASVVEYMTKHFQARQNCIQLERRLEQLGAQYRLISKRLLEKFKAKNPTPLGNLELLINDTQDDILEVTEQLKTAKNYLTEVKVEMETLLRLLVNLIRISDVKQINLAQLEASFCPNVQDIEGLGWEDYLDASLCFLLRTTLAKSEKDKLRAPHTSFEEIKEIAKVEKHLTTVLERISKPEKLLETNFDETIEETNSSENSEVKTLERLPMGSQIAESSSRALSARKDLLRRRQKVPEEN